MGSGAGAAVRFHNIYSGNYPPFQATALQRESDYGMERSAGTEAGPWVGLLSSPSLHALCSELWDAGIPSLSLPNPKCSPLVLLSALCSSRCPQIPQTPQMGSCGAVASSQCEEKELWGEVSQQRMGMGKGQGMALGQGDTSRATNRWGDVDTDLLPPLRVSSGWGNLFLLGCSRGKLRHGDGMCSGTGTHRAQL